MKSSFATLCFLSLFVFCAKAQKNSLSFESLLLSYFEIKNALVLTDAKPASEKAAKLVSVIKSIDIKTLSEAESNAFGSVNQKLMSSAINIAESELIEEQRKDFINLSDQIVLLAKHNKIANLPVYQQYCPMKKATWLSSKREIENPYYGNEMLDCGKVTATF